MIGKPIDAIEKSDLDDLAARKVTERRTLDYKRELNFRTDAEKKEFVADVLSFANSVGGDMIFGMDEAKDGSGKLGYPEPPNGFVPWATDDDMKRSLEQCVRDKSDPRVPAIEVKVVGGFADPKARAVVVRVAKSPAGPHESLADHRFWARATNGKYPLDVRQLRTVFVDGARQDAMVRDFVAERVGGMLAGFLEGGGYPVPIQAESDTASVVVHAVSSSFWDREQLVDVREFPPHDELLPRDGSARWVRRHNLDGIVFWKKYDGTPLDGETFEYRQLFRRGAVECADFYVPDRFRSFEVATGDGLEEQILQMTTSALGLLAAAGCAFPVFVFVSVLKLRGRTLRPTALQISPPAEARAFRIDRDLISLPDAAFFTPDADVAATLRTSFDALWQAGGWRGSPMYEPDGRRRAT